METRRLGGADGFDVTVVGLGCNAFGRRFDEQRSRPVIHAALDAGRAVIVDAVYTKPEERAAIEAVARDLGVPFHGLWLECPEDVMIARVAGRRADASDATLEVVRRQLGYDIRAITWHRLDASDAPEAVSATAKRTLSS